MSPYASEKLEYVGERFSVRVGQVACGKPLFSPTDDVAFEQFYWSVTPREVLELIIGELLLHAGEINDAD